MADLFSDLKNNIILTNCINRRMEHVIILGWHTSLYLDKFLNLQKQIFKSSLI